MRASWIVLPAGLFIACSKGNPTSVATLPDAGPSCTSNADCADGEVCTTSTGTCGSCKSSGQCLPHQNCAPPAPNQPNACVYQTGWGDDCKVNDDCPAGQVCKQGLCVDQQDATLCPTFTCPSGQICNRTNLVCEQNEGCFSDADCDSTEACNTGTNQCVLRCTASNVGTVCAADQICVSGRCAQCGSTADCSNGLTCNVAAGLCTNGNTCYSSSDCLVPLVCNPLTSQCTQPPPACVSDEQCPTGQSCDLAAGDCVPGSCQPDSYEPNDTPAEAASLGSGPDIDVSGLTLCNQVPGYFSFPMLQGDLVQVVVEADTLAAPTFSTTLLDPLGEAIGSGDLVAQGQADRDGTFLIRVQSTDNTQSYGLRIQIDHSSGACQTDAYQPNGTVAQATRTVPPGLNTLAICPGLEEYFAVDVPPDLGVHVEVDCDQSQGELLLSVFGSDGVTLLGQDSSGSDAEAVNLPVSTAGGQAIYARVMGAEPRSQNQYSLIVAFELPVPDAGAPPLPDGGDLDAGPSDAGPSDAGNVDAGELDAGTLDAGDDGGAG